MDDCHFDRSICKLRLPDRFPEPIQFSCTVGIIFGRARIFHVAVRLVLPRIQYHECHRALAESVIETSVMCGEIDRNLVEITPATLVISPRIDERDIPEKPGGRVQGM